MAADLRPFTRIDWYGFAGAESWGEGEGRRQPQVAYGVESEAWPEIRDEYFDGGLTLIVDRNGLQFLGKDGGYTLDLKDEALALRVARGILAMAPLSPALLAALGFQPFNLPPAPAGTYPPGPRLTS